MRDKIFCPDKHPNRSLIRWTYTYTGEQIAVGVINTTVNQSGFGLLQVKIGNFKQNITLVGLPRHYGGQQWYFVCPETNLRASVVWRPPGARRFASRHAWGRQVAYSSQFQTRCDRAISAAQRIRCRLGGPEWAGLDGNYPPKPKWMRWKTYDRHLERADAYEAIADQRLIALVAKWTGKLAN